MGPSGQSGPVGPPPNCPEGKVYKTCGTACPQTCDNLGEQLVCTRQCVEGCFCPEGTLENAKENCVQESDCPGGESPVLSSKLCVHHHHIH